MESALEKCLEELSQGPDVTGVVCCDTNGMVLASHAVSGAESCGGGLAAVVEAAAALEPEAGCDPVVLLEGENSSVLIHRSESVTLAVYKTGSHQ